MENEMNIKSLLQTFKKLSVYLRKSIGTGGLTLAQSMLVWQLYQNGPMKISELGKALDLSNPTVSGIVDRLEKSGTLKRVRSKKDRRVVYVEITTDFIKKHESFEASMENELGKLMKYADEKEKEAFEKGIVALENILIKADRSGEEKNV